MEDRGEGRVKGQCRDVHKMSTNDAQNIELMNNACNKNWYGISKSLTSKEELAGDMEI